jgi:hypothetical protein
MHFAHTLVGCLAMLIGQAQASQDLPSSEALAREIGPFLMKPLPSIEAVTGGAMPEPAPLMVVASFGNDDTVPDLDRGFAIGYTLNELLFDADPKLDVVPPGSTQKRQHRKARPAAWFETVPPTRIGRPGVITRGGV